MSSSLSQSAYDYIRQKLLRGELPLEKRISETALAREMGMSRTPVREAIRRLQSQGLLFQLPSSGTFVARPDRTQLVEAYEIREALECFAVVKAAQRMTAGQRDDLMGYCEQMRAAMRGMRDAGEAILDGQRLEQFLKGDLGFHLLLLRAAGNRMAIELFTESHMRNRVFGYRSHRRDLHHGAWVWLAHARIALAVRRRDTRAARRAMQRHIRTSLRDALATFDEQAASRAPGRPAQSGLADALDDLIQRLS